MKIVFICGSLEAGKNGVGDYCRRLAANLIIKGHSVAIISINDKDVPNDLNGFQVEGNTQVQVLRLASANSWEKRFEAAKIFIDTFGPHVVSLQYVPFSFNDKGLHFGFASNLKKVAPSVKWHIMFHELWVAMDNQSELKFKLLGFVQKQLVKSLVKVIKPVVVHTHSHIYKKQLELIGLKVNILPLFGNISVEAYRDIKDVDSVSFVAFGGLHFGADIEGFTNWLLKIQEEAKKPVLFHFIGHNGDEVNNWTNQFDKKGIKYIQHGMRDVAYVSQIFQSSDIGITTTPLLLTEKSGSVAAMLEHGLPTICIARQWIPSNPVLRKVEGLKPIKWSKDLTLNQVSQKDGSPNTVSKIGDLFINALSKYNT